MLNSPLDEVVPVFGGYPEAPWEGHREKLPPSSHFFFSKMRNDADIGADLLVKPNDTDWQLPYERYPFATCEMGGGVQVGHHRRPIIRPMDVYALSLVKLGCGNNLIGYYMFHGGTNGIGRHSIYNVPWCPVRDYDFQAPISQYGEIRPSYRLLILLNMFAADFGSVLAPMETVEADHRVQREDTENLRYALRTDGNGGFVFVNHYQRLDRLGEIRQAVIDTGSVRFPPINVVGEVCFFLPFNLRMGKMLLEYATAQPLCLVGDTTFFMEIEGIEPVYKFAERQPISACAGLASAFAEDSIKVVTLTGKQALGARKIDGKLCLCETEDLIASGGNIAAASGNKTFSYYVWETDGFTLKKLGDNVTEDKPQAKLVCIPCEQPFSVPEEYWKYLYADHYRSIKWFKLSVDSPNGFAEIDETFDVGQVYVDGMLAADRFYYGKPWRLPANLLYGKECYLAESQMEDDFYREF